MASTYARVLNTPELLEAILAQLPPRDLLRAQCISCSFRDTIQASPTLQQALFFRPAPVKEPGVWTINPLLQDLFLPWRVFPETNWDLPEYATLELLDWNCSPETVAAFQHPSASWRRMFLIQPPSKKLAVIRHVHKRGGDSISRGELSFESNENDGVRMDALYDIPLSFLSTNAVSQFGLQIRTSTDSWSLAPPGPKMVLYLVYTTQCCNFSPDLKSNLKSLAPKTWSISDIHFARQPREGADNSWIVKWQSDMTPQNGGITPSEFQEWQRKRAPISSLLADIR